MASAFTKDLLRSVRHSAGRFVAIAAIVALGCGFYAGLRMTCPDMKTSADAYYDETALMDVRVVSTLGLTDEDIDALRDVEGVTAVMPARETDVMAELGGEQYAVRVHTLPEGDDPSLNQLVLDAGRMPEAANECVISADRVMNAPVALGDVLTVVEGSADVDDTLTTREFTVVGFAHSPYYVCSTSMGSTTLGSGSIQQFAYVLPDAFAEDVPYTEAFALVEGAAEEFAGSDAYQAAVDAVLARVEGIADERAAARTQGLRAEAQAELDDARAEYEQQRADAEAELADAAAQLDSAAAQLAQSEADLASGRSAHAQGTDALAQQRASAEEQLASQQAQLDAAAAQLEQSESQLAATRAQLDAGWAQAGVSADQAQAALSAMKEQLAALKEAASKGSAEAEAAYQQLSAHVAALEQLVAGEAAYAEGERAYQAAATQLADGRAALEAARAQANAQLSEAQAQLDAAAARIQSGEAQLEQGRVDYAQGQADYEAARADADERFADAEAELADAQADIDAIPQAEWLVMDRTKNSGAVSFSSDAERVDSIAQVFPFIFFLVAALVALTTMTRMVEEERVLIGTYKALGYSRGRIASKYLIYAASASVIGAVAGIAVLSQVLPAVIMQAYAIIYSVPHSSYPIDWPIAALSAGLGVGITLVATWAAAAATCSEQPARLMLPRAPKAGKRILLERVTSLWRRLSFSWKVTCRNLFRYKKRLIMTVIGIAGCTALLLTGLGLQNAIDDIIDKEFGEIVHYDVAVTLDTDASDEALEQVAALASTPALTQDVSMVTVTPDGTNLNATVITPESPEAFENLWTMRERLGAQPVALGDDSVLVTEKLASKLGIGVGDALELFEQDAMGNAVGAGTELTVTGVVENYVANYVFAGKAAYERAFGEAPTYRTMYGIAGEGDAAHEAFAAAARGVDGVKTVSFNAEIIDTYRTMLKSVGMIVVVLVVAAAALAFIVLYNLTNINITERVREIATLKVLGFTPRETQAYIFRETMLLTVLGCAVGLLLGIVLEGFVVTTAEVDYVMFGREIHAISYVLAFALTLLFACLVMLAMRRKLAKVDMVESWGL
ncbi:MAG: FtsX-like permease family protein [Eggerthellaceae bacterium]|nr:FtsX-like permease family protein [Eggerthellaceae bacterium]